MAPKCGDINVVLNSIPLKGFTTNENVIYVLGEFLHLLWHFFLEIIDLQKKFRLTITEKNWNPGNLVQHGVNLVYYAAHTISKFCSKVKDKSPTMDKSNNVYSQVKYCLFHICSECGKLYVDQSLHLLKDRVV